MRQPTIQHCTPVYLYVLFCASDILSTSFPEKDTLHSHKGNLQQRDGRLFLVKHTNERKIFLVMNQPACILSWCFSFPWVGNSLAQPLKEQLHQMVKKIFFNFFKKWDLRWPSWLKSQLLHQMRSHLLKRQKLLVLTLMGFQLVPLDEILSTALMVTLKENETKSKPVHHNTPQTTYQYNEIKGKRRDLRIIVLDIASPASGEPEPCGSSCWYLWQRPQGIHQPDTWRREQVNSWNAAWETPKINVTIPRRRKKRNIMAYLCGFSPLWLSSCLVSW